MESGHCNFKLRQRIKKVQYHSQYFCRGNTKRLRGVGDKDRICKIPNGRVRSLSIEDSDKMIWDTVVDVVKDSNNFRENFKTEVMKEIKSFGQASFEKKSIQRNIKRLEDKI